MAMLKAFVYLPIVKLGDPRALDTSNIVTLRALRKRTVLSKVKKWMAAHYDLISHSQETTVAVTVVGSVVDEEADA